MRAKQQSRIRWLKEGDANTGFFHAAIKARRAKNLILNLNDNGVTTSDPLRITHLFSTRFRHLFNQSHATTRIPQDLIHRVLNLEDNRPLCALASMEELHSVIKHLNANQAPGVDGYNGMFYQAAWPIITKDLLEDVNNILHAGKLLTKVNHTLICLILKKAIPDSVDDYRLVALCMLCIVSSPSCWPIASNHFCRSLLTSITRLSSVGDASQIPFS